MPDRRRDKFHPCWKYCVLFFFRSDMWDIGQHSKHLWKNIGDLIIVAKQNIEQNGTKEQHQIFHPQINLFWGWNSGIIWAPLHNNLWTVNKYSGRDLLMLQGVFLDQRAFNPYLVMRLRFPYVDTALAPSKGQQHVNLLVGGSNKEMCVFIACCCFEPRWRRSSVSLCTYAFPHFQLHSTRTFSNE